MSKNPYQDVMLQFDEAVAKATDVNVQAQIVAQRAMAMLMHDRLTQIQQQLNELARTAGLLASKIK